MAELNKTQKDHLLGKVKEVLERNELPFSNFVLLNDDVLIDVFSVPGGLPSGTLQVRIEKGGTMTANLSWTM